MRLTNQPTFAPQTWRQSEACSLGTADSDNQCRTVATLELLPTQAEHRDCDTHREQNFVGIDSFIYTVVDDGITVGIDGQFRSAIRESHPIRLRSRSCR